MISSKRSQLILPIPTSKSSASTSLTTVSSFKLYVQCTSNNITGKLDWGDYPVITLKRYLYGMALTSRLEIVRLFSLDNDVSNPLS